MNKEPIEEFIEAIRKDEFLTVSLLLHQGVDINERYGSYKHLIPLCVGASGGCSIEMFEFLIQNGADVNFIDVEQDEHILFRCMWAGEIERLEILLKNGADSNHVARNGETILYSCLGFGTSRHQYAKLLLKYGADPNLSAYENLNTYRSPLDVAISINDTETVKLLIEAGTDIMREPDPGKTVQDLLLSFGIDYKSMREQGLMEESYQMER